jgi:hypothetical protein
VRIEVKTKDRTVAPRANFECSVPAYVVEHQQADFFVFVSLERDRADATVGLRRFVRAHIVGVSSLGELRSKSVLRKAGERDVNGTVFWTDCHNVKISQTRSMLTAIHDWQTISDPFCIDA